MPYFLSLVAALALLIGNAGHYHRASTTAVSPAATAAPADYCPTCDNPGGPSGG